MRDADVRVPLRDLGVPAAWHPHGNRAQILADLGLTAQDVAREVTGWMSRLDDTAPAEDLGAAAARDNVRPGP